MNVTEALQQRKSVRAFLNKSIEKSKIDAILSAARYAPSGVNTQPWQVAVISGAKKKSLEQTIEQAFQSGDKGRTDYTYAPDKWAEPYKSRRKACGLQMYSTLDIKREDTQQQIEQWVANYRAFDAPVLLLFFMDNRLEKGSFLDYGMFLQSVMLAAVEQGLATCAQAAFAHYPHIIKPQLKLSNETLLICGMALGYEDTEALINSYRTPREELSSFVSYYN